MLEIGVEWIRRLGYVCGCERDRETYEGTQDISRETYEGTQDISRERGCV